MERWTSWKSRSRRIRSAPIGWKKRPDGPRIALGEEFTSKWDFTPYLEAGVVDFCRLDLCLSGGFTRGMLCAADAAQPAGRSGFRGECALRFVTAMLFVSGVSKTELKRDARIDAVFPHRVTAGAGIATPNDASDLGIKVNETVLTALPEMEWYAPQLTNHSGGIALW